MASPAKLRLVSNETFVSKEINLWGSKSVPNHSLFGLINYPYETRYEIPENFISKYTCAGESVLDPFCGAGSIPLVAALSGRIPYCSDIDPLALCLTAAKLQPVDITEITLFLQSINLKKPVSINENLKGLLEFYDIDTLREILNLRKFLLNSYHQSARFVEVIAQSLLHGNTSGYFSVFTNPQHSLSIEQQRQLNIDRTQRPEYRAIVPRILKKAAQVTVDGIPTVLLKAADSAIIKVGDARKINYLSDQAVDFVLTSIPLPNQVFAAESQWLKFWFSDISPEVPVNYAPLTNNPTELSRWEDFIKTSFREVGRVTSNGRFCVIHYRDYTAGANIVNLSDNLIRIFKEDLSDVWKPVELLNQDNGGVQLKNALKSRSDSIRAIKDHFLVLKKI